jgi:hypothetical protein
MQIVAGHRDYDSPEPGMHSLFMFHPSILARCGAF